MDVYPFSKSTTSPPKIAKQVTLDEKSCTFRSGFLPRKRRKASILKSASIASINNSMKIKKLIKLLKYLNIGLCSILCIFLLSWCLFELNYFDNKSYCGIINDLGQMKFYIYSIGLRMRSLDLNLKGYPTALTSDQYISSILVATTNLSHILYGLGQYSSVMSINEEIVTTKYTIWKFQNGIPTSLNSNLFEGISQLISVTNSLIVGNLTDADSLLFIYRNSFSSLFTTLNETSYKILNQISDKSDILLEEADWIKAFIFLPILIFFIISIPIFIILETINKEQWNSISSISYQTFSLIRTKVIERLNRLHNLDINAINAENYKADTIYTSIWKNYFVSGSILLILLSGYFLTENFVIEASLHYLNNLKVDHRFWEDLQRSLSQSSYIWAREEKMQDFTNISYINLLPDIINIPTLFQAYDHTIEELLIINTYITTQTKDAIIKNYDYSTYVDILSYDPCNALQNVFNCEGSIIKYGIGVGMNIYKLDLDNTLNSNSTINWNDLAKLENTSYTFADAYFDSNNYFETNTDDCLNKIFNSLIGLCLIIIIIIILYSFLVLRPQIIKIQDELLSRNQINIMFKDSKFSGTPSMQSETVVN